MKKVGFIGAYDKTDLIIYVAKILTALNKSVLIVDATTTQKSRYVVPAINPTVKYVTEYEEIDIALTKAEELFKRGKYKESIDLSIKSLSFIDKNIVEKIQ